MIGQWLGPIRSWPSWAKAVMELVDSEDLSRRIARGAISIDEAIPIAKQIAEAPGIDSFRQFLQRKTKSVVPAAPKDIIGARIHTDPQAVRPLRVSVPGGNA